MNLSAFVVPPSAAELQAKPSQNPSVIPNQSRRFYRGEFIRGPLPLEWMGPAAKIPGKALHVALAIWFEYGRRKNPSFRLSSAIFERFGVGRKAAYAGLASLEEAGLVKVERQHGKNPVISLLKTEQLRSEALPARSGEKEALPSQERLHSFR